MKIAIVEDMDWVVENMMGVAEEAGHEVLGVHIGRAPNPKYHTGPDKIQCHTTNLDEAATAIRAFQPDLIFVDHFFDLEKSQTGALLVYKLGVSPEKCVGISSITQNYCGRSFWGKEVLAHTDRKGNERARETFLKLLSE